MCRFAPDFRLVFHVSAYFDKEKPMEKPFVLSEYHLFAAIARGSYFFVYR